MEGRTKLPMSALVKNLNHPTDGWKDEPSRPRGPWKKI